MKNSTTEHERNCTRGLEMIRRAQAWAKTNKIEREARTIMREHVEQNRGVYTRLTLKRKGFSGLLHEIEKDLKPTPEHHYQSWWVFAFHGIAYPTKKWVCKNCGKQLTRLRLEFCTPSCQKKHQARSISAALRRISKTQWESIAAQRQRTLQQRYGVTSMMQIPEVAERSREALISRTAEEKQQTQRKRDRTLVKKYGPDAKKIIELRAAEGVRRAYKERGAEIYQARSRRFMQEHGVGHHMQLPETWDKTTRFKHKYIEIEGKTYRCQGYEPFVLHHLATQGFKFSTQPKGIPYSCKGKRRMYFPDIRAVKGKKRLLIEVKSTYTFHWTVQNCPDKLIQATRYAEEKGVIFYVIIVDPSKMEAKVITNPKSIKELSLRRAATLALCP